MYINILININIFINKYVTNLNDNIVHHNTLKHINKSYWSQMVQKTIVYINMSTFLDFAILRLFQCYICTPKFPLQLYNMQSTSI